MTIMASKVDAYIYSAQDLFSIASNLTPFMHSTQGNRASTAARMLSQAMSLTNKETPLVQVYDKQRKKTWEDIVGGYLNPVLGNITVGNQIMPGSGKVTRVTDDYIYIRQDQDGQTIKKGLYNNFPLNQDGFLHSTPLVKAGDRVNANTPLAESNYSIKNTLALGKNLSVAYMP